VNQEDIVAYVAPNFEGVNIIRPDDGPGADDTFFIYDPERDLPDNKQMPLSVTKPQGARPALLTGWRSRAIGGDPDHLRTPVRRYGKLRV
jgi:hypothetical protein